MAVPRCSLQGSGCIPAVKTPVADFVLEGKLDAFWCNLVSRSGRLSVMFGAIILYIWFFEFGLWHFAQGGVPF